MAEQKSPSRATRDKPQKVDVESWKYIAEEVDAATQRGEEVSSEDKLKADLWELYESFSDALEKGKEEAKKLKNACIETWLATNPHGINADGSQGTSQNPGWYMNFVIVGKLLKFYWTGTKPRIAQVQEPPEDFLAARPPMEAPPKAKKETFQQKRPH